MPLLVLAPEPLLMVKSVGSINQVPTVPLGASVLSLAPSCTETCEADVSMKPPLPPSAPPCARQVPSTVIVLAVFDRSAMAVMSPPLPALAAAASASTVPVLTMLWLARKRITPPLSSRPLACKVPLFLTTPLSNWLAACADKMIRPPGACTALPFSTRAATVAGVTTMLARLFCLSNCSSKLSPAARATVPILAITMPLLRTSGASRAM